MLELEPNYFYVIGHRGNEAYDYENTISAFARSVEFGVDMIETDLQYTKDEKVILFHDKILNKKTNLKGKVTKKQYNEILNGEYNFKKIGNEKICSLDDLISFIQSPNVLSTKFIFELKIPFKKNSIKEIVRQILINHLEDRIIIDSFYPKNLSLVRKESNNICLSLLIKKFLNNKIQKDGISYLNSLIKKFEDLKLSALSLHKSNLLPSIVKYFKSQNFIVFGYGIKNPVNYDDYIKINGLNGFTATHPDHLLNKRKEILGY